MRLQLKDVFSLANALCGFLALALFFIFGFASSFALLLLAVLFDYFDGRIARKGSASNEFGKQIDSLSDAVSFGAVPAALVLFQHYPGTPVAFFAVLLGGLFYVAAVIVRLAEYNLQKEKGFYHGLPCPFAALLLLLFGWFDWRIAVFALFALGILMLSKFRLKKVF